MTHQDDRSLREQDLLDQASRLPRDIAPERDLWPGIEAAMAGEPDTRASGWSTRWPAAATLAASLLLALLIGYGTGRGLPDTPGVAEISPREIQTVNLVETTGLLAARRAMAAEIETGLERLPPDAQSVVIENLATIGAALDEIDAVLAEAPSSGLDRQVLMAMYVDQLALLGSVRQLVIQSNQETLL